MDKLGLNRYCCRRMIMTHVDLIEKLLKYALSRGCAASVRLEAANNIYLDTTRPRETLLGSRTGGSHGVDPSIMIYSLLISPSHIHCTFYISPSVDKFTVPT